MTNALVRDTDYLTNLLKRLCWRAVQPKTLRDDLYLPLVQCFQKAIDLFREILFAQKFERCKRLLIRNVFAQRSLFFVTNRRVERCWPKTHCPQTRDFFVRNSKFFCKFLVGGFPAKII